MRAIAPFDETEEDEQPNMDDLNKTFRTRFITIWLLMNSVLGEFLQYTFLVCILIEFVFNSSHDYSTWSWSSIRLFPRYSLDHIWSCSCSILRTCLVFVRRIW